MCSLNTAPCSRSSVAGESVKSRCTKYTNGAAGALVPLAVKNFTTASISIFQTTLPQALMSKINYLPTRSVPNPLKLIKSYIFSLCTYASIRSLCLRFSEFIGHFRTNSVFLLRNQIHLKHLAKRL